MKILGDGKSLSKISGSWLQVSTMKENTFLELSSDKFWKELERLFSTTTKGSFLMILVTRPARAEDRERHFEVTRPARAEDRERHLEKKHPLPAEEENHL